MLFRSGYYPLGGIIISDAIYKVLKAGTKGIFAPGHTYSGTPMAGAVGVAVHEYIQRHGLMKNVKQLQGYLWEQLQTLSKYRIVGDIRGRGFMLGMEFVRDRQTKEPFPCQEPGYAAGVVSKKAMHNGLVLYPGSGSVDGHHGDHVLIAPPFIISKEEIDELIARFDRTLQEAESELPG